jgi:hypothetical protein
MLQGDDTTNHVLGGPPGPPPPRPSLLNTMAHACDGTPQVTP